MRLRANVGASSDIEISLAALEVAQLHAVEDEARRQLEARKMDLREALDATADEALVLTTALDDLAPAPPDASLLARARAERPELASTR
jgi:hypothetical protein